MFERKADFTIVASDVPLLAAPDLRAAYATCREITRVASKTFYLASLFLSPEKRRVIWAVYAFCRTADDVVDRTAPAAERLSAIDELERKLLAAVAGRASEPIFVAYADAVRRFDIPLGPALALLRGARMDVTVRRYATYDELCDYCYLVASTVGLLVAPILGYQSPEALEYGVMLGRAMQLTNILRDVGEDAMMGRIYLPKEDLDRFGYSESNVFEGVVDETFVALMQFQIKRVRELYAQAEPGIAMLNPESRYTVRLALSLYRRILRAIELNDYDVYGRRAYVPLRSKIVTALSVALAR
ncbi:MAG: squalene/phytoene synthase family protein [Candidatus Baltobacteraceae bacterium]